MKSKSFNALLILTSLIGYLEWGKDNHSFLFQAEAEIIAKLFVDPFSVIHPFTFLPLIGQVMLLITLFQKQPNRLISFIGMIGIGILLLLMFVIGLMSMNIYILVSTIPYLVTSFLMVRFHINRSKGINIIPK